MGRLAGAFGGALMIAGVSTIGDYLWATRLPHHQAVYGLIHGTLLFLCVGLWLGLGSRQPVRGAAGGALIGLLAAATFYLLQPVIGYGALFVLWIGLWPALGLLNGRLLRHQSTGELLIRSTLAALGSGLAFYAISGIWFPFDPRGWDYAIHFVSWTVAYLPAFLALGVKA